MPPEDISGNKPQAIQPGSRLVHLHHQLNQPLTAINNYARAGCQLIDQGMGDSAQLRELFEKIFRQGTRAADFSREIGELASGPGQVQQ